MANLGQLRTKARSLLDEPTEAFYLDVELNSFINAAYSYYHEIAVNSGYSGLLATPNVLDIVSGTATVALPADTLRPKRLERVLSTQKVPLSYKERFDTATSTTGSSASSLYLPEWCIEGANIRLDPTPQFSETGGLELTSWPEITEMSADGDEPAAGFRKSWHEMLAIRACMFAKGGKEEAQMQNLAALLAPHEMNFNNAIATNSSGRTSVEPFVTG